MALLKYSVLRFAFIFLCAGALYLVGARGWLMWIMAVLVGMLLSYLLLGREQAAVDQELGARKARKDERFGKGAAQDAEYEDGLNE